MSFSLNPSAQCLVLGRLGGHGSFRDAPRSNGIPGSTRCAQDDGLVCLDSGCHGVSIDATYLQGGELLRGDSLGADGGRKGLPGYGARNPQCLGNNPKAVVMIEAKQPLSSYRPQWPESLALGKERLARGRQVNRLSRLGVIVQFRKVDLSTHAQDRIWCCSRGYPVRPSPLPSGSSRHSVEVLRTGTSITRQVRPGPVWKELPSFRLRDNQR